MILIIITHVVVLFYNIVLHNTIIKGTIKCIPMQLYQKISDVNCLGKFHFYYWNFYNIRHNIYLKISKSFYLMALYEKDMKI